MAKKKTGYYDRRTSDGRPAGYEKGRGQRKPIGGMTPKERLEYRKSVGLYKPRKKKSPELKEDIPANSMGASSSTPGTGAIDMFDPLLLVKKKLKDRMKEILLKRKPPPMK